MNEENSQFIIGKFDYDQYKKGIITARLQVIIDHIVSQAPYDLRAYLKYQQFELQSKSVTDTGEKLTLEFPNISNEERRQIKNIPMEITLKRE